MPRQQSRAWGTPCLIPTRIALNLMFPLSEAGHSAPRGPGPHLPGKTVPQTLARWPQTGPFLLWAFTLSYLILARVWPQKNTKTSYLDLPKASTLLFCSERTTWILMTVYSCWSGQAFQHQPACGLGQLCSSRASPE